MLPRHAALLLILLISQVGCSLGVHLGPAQRPRRLQYVGPALKHTAGMLDRMAIFRILAALGKFHDASVHLVYFGSPEAYLSRSHSATINKSWGHYFLEDLPFDGVIKRRPDCVTFTEPSTDLFRIFDGGVTCVNLNLAFYGDSAIHQFLEIYNMGDDLRPSRAVVSAVDELEMVHNLRSSGAIHIRRCDLLPENRLCTEPSAVAGAVDALPAFTSWVVFWYAEEGYKEQLRSALAKPGRRVLFEDELLLNPFEDGDNYFAFMAAQELFRRATATVDTHRCGYGPDPRVEQQHMGLWGAGRGAAAAHERLSAVCSSDTS